ncbi:MAG: arsenosugar biosynthesis radical SAM protein ArsS [Myxococcota bacterium]|nr:arsenosugar biosynthesis radical SAM protein ArsS [Myxococcota bacterium]
MEAPEAPLDATPGFRETLRHRGLGPLRRGAARTLQVNVGRLCDLACHHCHVEAGPKRTERMDRATAERVLAVLAANPGLRTLDLTGGAPELHEVFRPLVRGARRLGREVIDRCNLTAFFQPGQEDTPEFLAEHRVRVVASLPCYTAENVDAQRGRRVFDRSIEALQRLNGLGYGQPGSSLRLDLVYNPLGPSLPPAQAELETRYREELAALFGITFHELVTITNMPIKRFARALAREGRHEAYMSLLVEAFNPDTVPALMCRETISVGWDGSLHDCDFNQMLELPLGGRPRTVWELSDVAELVGNEIATGSHCFGCTAGSGSSCSGALTRPDPARRAAAGAVPAPAR